MAAASPSLNFTSIIKFRVSPIFPMHTNSFKILPKTQRLFLSSSHSTFNLRIRVRRLGVGESEEEFEMDESEEECEEYEEEEDESILDFESMEQEARDVVRDYSVNLSRQLGIGILLGLSLLLEFYEVLRQNFKIETGA